MLENSLLAREGVNGTVLYDNLADETHANFDLRLMDFYLIVSSHEKVHRLFLGTEVGEFFAVGWDMESDFEMAKEYTVACASNGTLSFRDLDTNGKLPPNNRAPRLSLDVGYDPRVRPWYLAVLEKLNSSNFSWSKTFLDVAQFPSLGIVLAKPFLLNESLIGVIGTLLMFDEMGNWLRDEANIGDGGLLFLVDREGFMIASSVGIVRKRETEDSDWEKIRPTQHSSSIVRSVAEALNQLFPPDSSEQQDNGLLLWSSPGLGFTVTDPESSVQYLVDLLKWTDPYGLEVFLVDVFPRVNMYRRVDLATRLSLGFSGGSLVLVAVIATVFGYCLSNPIRRTSNELKRIARFEEKPNRGCPASGNSCFRPFQLAEFVRMDRIMNELKVGLSQFGRFVPRDIVGTLVRKGASSLRLKRQMITVMFVDVQGFTRLTELLPPDALVAFLTEFFDLSTRIIDQAEGTIDKLIGDCVMALWNAPSPVPNHAVQAVRAAVSLLDEIDSRNSQLTPHCGRIPFDVRCGINSGWALVGLIGSQEKCSYTALGDVVNVAARLEPITKQFSSRILIGPATEREVNDVFVCQFVDTVVLKGKKKPLRIYSVEGSSSEIACFESSGIRNSFVMKEKTRID